LGFIICFRTKMLVFMKHCYEVHLITWLIMLSVECVDHNAILMLIPVQHNRPSDAIKS
jgi:hypothetical protein